jgi:hypothetical protein
MCVTGLSLPKNARLQLLVDLLKVYGRSEGITAKQLLNIIESKEISVSIKTIYRDLQEISLYSPITENIVGREIFWIWADSDSQINFQNSVENNNRDMLLRYLKLIET